MCRWFAYISPNEDSLLEDVLVEPAQALSKQVNEDYLPKSLFHAPAAEHTTAAEIAFRNRVSCLAANVASTCIPSHVRMATSSAITPVNNHPFVFGRHTIMHNGCIADYAAVDQQMEGLMSAAAYKHMLGRTDSGSFAALYMTYLCAGNGNGDGGEAREKIYNLNEMLEALQFAANSVIELQVNVLNEKPRANDLSVGVTDGERLVAMRFQKHEIQQPPSLYYSTTAGVTMNRCEGEKRGDQVINPFAHKRPEEHGRHVIVANEPTTYNAREWELIEKNHAVLVGDGQLRVQQLTRIEAVGCGT